MATVTSKKTKIKVKRLSKSKRTHARRVKQNAGKTGSGPS